MSNYTDYRAGLRVCHKYLKEHDISDCILRADGNPHKLRAILNFEHPIEDYWQETAWFWMINEDLIKVMETGTFEL